MLGSYWNVLGLFLHKAENHVLKFIIILSNYDYNLSCCSQQPKPVWPTFQLILLNCRKLITWGNKSADKHDWLTDWWTEWRADGRVFRIVHDLQFDQFPLPSTSLQGGRDTSLLSLFTRLAPDKLRLLHQQTAAFISALATADALQNPGAGCQRPLHIAQLCPHLVSRDSLGSTAGREEVSRVKLVKGEGGAEEINTRPGQHAEAGSVRGGGGLASESHVWRRDSAH